MRSRKHNYIRLDQTQVASEQIIIIIQMNAIALQVELKIFLRCSDTLKFVDSPR